MLTEDELTTIRMWVAMGLPVEYSAVTLQHTEWVLLTKSSYHDHPYGAFLYRIHGHAQSLPAGAGRGGDQDVDPDRAAG